jgi:hypothetical protein
MRRVGRRIWWRRVRWIVPIIDAEHLEGRIDHEFAATEGNAAGAVEQLARLVALIALGETGVVVGTAGEKGRAVGVGAGAKQAVSCAGVGLPNGIAIGDLILGENDFLAGEGDVAIPLDPFSGSDAAPNLAAANVHG